ncbi:ATP-binding protein [Marinobacter sp. 71-i]|uniref:histidine kinase n=1 Tax=Marinobacter iranensis TaxID=2962607 RepID=A0ABT5Y842_9GAMM|nr:ATP-binding protein [Marinobacter iranensis]
MPFWLFVGLFSLALALFFTHPWLMRYEINQAKADSLQRLGAYKTSLLATIDRHLYLPRVLASDPRIVNSLGSLEEGEAPSPGGFPTSRLLEQINRKAGSDEIFLMDPDGTTHYSSNYTTEDSFVGMNYGFRPYFRDALAGAPGFYFAVGATSGIPGLFLSAPVYAESGKTQGVIVVKIDLRKLEQSWKASGDAVWVTDKRGIIFLASSAKWHYTTLQPLSDEVKSELAETRQYGNGPITPLKRVTEWQSDDWSTLDLNADGPQLVFGSSIPGYPWQMHHRMPLAEVQTQVQWKQSMTVLLYAGLAVGSLFYRERRRRTHAQNALARLTAERESHQRAIIQNTDVGLLNLDDRFRPLYLNERARRLFRLGSDDTFSDPSELIQPWHPEEAGNGSSRAEGVSSDGNRFPILYTLNPIRVGEHNEFILTVQDVTELTAAQQALQEANRVLEHRVQERTRDLEEAQAELAQNQKLAALGRMSAAIAHEINQPITALSNFVASSQMLLARNKIESVNENFLKIEGLVARLSKLSRQLRIFSGKRNTGSAFVSLQAPVHYALELLGQRLASEQVECHQSLPCDYQVRANAMVLEQIIVNLLTNAVDALDGQADARIDIRLIELETSPGKVSLSIEDNGPGMGDEQLSHVFEPFFTTKPMGKGLGLGLAISYSLACDIGAELTVSSRPGKGTCFSLILPIASAEKRENHS